MSSAVTWAQEFLERTGYSLEGEPQLIHDLPWSKVFCFHTAYGQIYLKIPAEVFAHESVLFNFLSKEGILHIPKIISYNPSLKCFLMKDAGNPLRENLKKNFDLLLTSHTLRTYANIQVICIDYVDQLLNVGVNDWRLAKLPSLYNTFITNHTLFESEGLNYDEIKQLENLSGTFQILCERLSALGIPETLEQGDFHDNNILVRDQEVTISDFGDASISHPFFSIISFLDSLQRNHSFNKQDPNYIILRNCYLQKWGRFADIDNILKAFDITCQLRPFMFALSFSRIKNCPDIDKFPEYNGYLANAIRTLISYISAS